MTMTTNTQMKCPLCIEGILEYHEPITDALPVKKSHVWICDACPFIGFEYWHPKDAQLVADFIKFREES